MRKSLRVEVVAGNIRVRCQINANIACCPRSSFLNWNLFVNEGNCKTRAAVLLQVPGWSHDKKKRSDTMFIFIQNSTMYHSSDVNRFWKISSFWKRKMFWVPINKVNLISLRAYSRTLALSFQFSTASHITIERITIRDHSLFIEGGRGQLARFIINPKQILQPLVIEMKKKWWPLLLLFEKVHSPFPRSTVYLYLYLAATT